MKVHHSTTVAATIILLVANAQIALPQESVRNIVITMDLDRCVKIEKDAHNNASGPTWVCPGLKEMPIFYRVGDARDYISFGYEGRTSRAFEQSLNIGDVKNPFNSLFRNGEKIKKIEVRAADAGGQVRPYAAVVRFYNATPESDGKLTGQTLVLYKISEDDACQVAHIDAFENRDANKLAARMVEELAAGFDCQNDPTIIGLRR